MPKRHLEATETSADIAASISDDAVMECIDILDDIGCGEGYSKTVPQCSGMSRSQREASISSHLARMSRAQSSDQNSFQNDGEDDDVHNDPWYVDKLTAEQQLVLTEQMNLTPVYCNGDVDWSHLVWDGDSHGHFNQLMERVATQIDLLTCDSRCTSFYLGLTWSPARRWCGRMQFPQDADYDGHRATWDKMYILASSATRWIGEAEKAVIEKYRTDARCMNRAGGGGGRGKDWTVSTLYCCMALSDDLRHLIE